MNKPQMPALAACAAMLLSSCTPGLGNLDCWTRERSPTPLMQEEMRPLLSKVFHGKVAVPDSSNPFIGPRVRFTGETCSVLLRGEGARVLVDTDILPGPAALTGSMSGGPWYIAHGEDGTAVVVQTHAGRVVAVTLTGFGEDGVLVYGKCGDPSMSFRECVVDRAH